MLLCASRRLLPTSPVDDVMLPSFSPNLAAEALLMHTDTTLFQKERHIAYWKRCLNSPLPHAYTSNESNRMTLACFTLSALDLLGVLDDLVPNDTKEGGFPCASSTWEPANIPATYFALATLAILGDDFKRVKRRKCLLWLRKMQREDGSFGEFLSEDGHILGGHDTRPAYCAVASRWMLNGGSLGSKSPAEDIDEDKLVQSIAASQVGTLACVKVLQVKPALTIDRHMMAAYLVCRFWKLKVGLRLP
ncbi:hypothetical protein MRB53_037897 [Persea americana]|nr:hypothetical protein MRB53_037897 [Persea americana]